MAIHDEDIVRVRDATDLVGLVSERVALKRVGRNWVGLCPFHTEKTGSFNVSAETGRYKCFGCGAGGDAITFVRETDHVDFVEAVERLAARAGITIRLDSEKAGRERQRRQHLLEVMARAVDFYHDRLLTGPDAGAARGYLRSRGYDREIVERFALGWSPEGWDHLVKALREPEDVLRDTGLGFRNSRGGLTDAFRGRVMFPIFDAAGHPVAFGGRILSGEGPKYKNSTETPIYSKSRTLYALNWAKAAVVETGEVVVCEGYTDVIGYFLAGVPRAVATCGTALTEDHVRTLRNFAEKRIVLSFDADAAGQAAADRFYEWEQRYAVDIAVVGLPAGADPADVARTDPGALDRAVAEAEPFLAFRIGRALDAADLRNPEGRARAAEAALAAIREHPNEIVRRAYAGRVAMRCDLPLDQLLSLLDRRGGPVRVRTPAPVPAPADSPELMALRLAVHRPEEVAHRLDRLLFTLPANVCAFDALCESETLHDAIAAAPPEAAEVLERVAVEEVEVDADDVVVLLARRAAAAEAARLEREAGANPERFADLAPAITWLRATEKQLADGDGDGRPALADGLVAWLAGRQPGRGSA